MKGHFNSQRDFGIEIEFLIPNDKTQQDVANALSSLGVRTRVEGYNHTTRNHWKIVGDVSVNGNRTHHGGNELVSPRLSGQSGLDELEKVCQVLNMMDCQVNKSCGLHIHQDVTNIVNESDANAKRFIKNLVGFVAKYEHIIYKLVAPSRLDNRRYSVPCRSMYFQGHTSNPSIVKNYMENKIKDGVRLKSTSNGMRELQRGRTCGLNLYKIWDRGSVEFRYHNGTLNFDKIKSWIVVTNAIINSVNETNFVKLCYVPNGSRGLASFRGAIGFVGRSGNQDGTPYTNDQLTKDANLFIQRRYRELNRNEERYERHSDYRYVKDGTFQNNNNRGQ
tara:strand:- start:9342 stop:10343 length:1002 start_codon:yes stop_codon:yes gene_type:complete